ncbi:MAG: hypothetical protein ACUZ8O_14385 [Candidatus Anammoxibacter sp.]
MTITYFDRLKDLAAQNGGEVLSEEYHNVRTRMRFKCKEGHKWWAYPYNVNAGCWCPKCGNKKKGAYLKHEMEFIHELAEIAGIKCLSTEYTNRMTKLLWQCSKGHKFREDYHTLSRRRNPCKKCPRLLHRTSVTIEKLQKMAQRRGGEVLSKTYLTGAKKMQFKCKKGHTFWKPACEVSKGSWCPTCLHEELSKKTKIPLKAIQSFAKIRFAKCVTTPEEYKSNPTNLKWICSEGHKFSGSYSSTKKRKNFCTKCASKKSD